VRRRGRSRGRGRKLVGDNNHRVNSFVCLQLLTSCTSMLDPLTSDTPNAHACRAKKLCAEKPGKPSAVVMSAAAHVDSLDYEARKRYFQKLQTESEVLPDPYSLVNEQWIDDVRRWPSLEIGDVYTYSIETKGPFTKNH